MEYVTHTCKRCEKAFIDEDLFDSQNFYPNWKYCPECSKYYENMIPNSLLVDVGFKSILFRTAVYFNQRMKRINFKTIFNEALKSYKRLI